MSCPKGAFPTMRHNEIRDLTANLLTEVCSDVCTKPELTPLEGEQMRLASTNVQDGARVDIRAKGFWGCPQQRAFFRVLRLDTLSMKKQRRECTNSESVTLSMDPSPHLFLARQEEWEKQPTFSTNV